MDVPFNCRVIPQTNPICTACVIFFHGSGGNADELMKRINNIYGDISFPHIKWIFPQAPARPYTLLNGQPSTVWFDRLQLSIKAPEQDSVDEMCHRLSPLIDREVANGIPKNRIIVGGFSMGGAMAMTLAYKYHWDFAGVFALSSFLNYNSSVYKALEQKSDVRIFPSLFMCHGNRDKLTDVEWAKETLTNLKRLGVTGKLETFDMDHELIKDEIASLRSFIYKQLPTSSRL